MIPGVFAFVNKQLSTVKKKKNSALEASLKRNSSLASAWKVPAKYQPISAVTHTTVKGTSQGEKSRRGEFNEGLIYRRNMWLHVN